MAQKPQKDQITKPVEADRTVRLPRKGLGTEKDEPTQALQASAPAADSTLRLKRDEMSFEEPTVALRAGAPAADATLRLKRDEMSLEEPTVGLNIGVPAADSTMRLKRDEMSLEEPTVALNVGVPAADSTLRLKRDELSLEEPTVTLNAGAPAADSTLRLKREEMSLEEPTQALKRPKLRTAMEVIDEATLVEAPKAKPSVMLPDATDIPSWEETTQLFTPPSAGHSEPTVRVPRSMDRPSVQVDPSDSMDETFSHASMPVLPQNPAPGPMEATSLMQVVESAEPEEDTLILPDMHELDELPNAMKSTMVMPVMEAPPAPPAPEPMEATTILKLDPAPAPAPMEKTMVMPMVEGPAAPEAPEPMEATTILKLDPAPAPAPMEKTMVMPMVEAPAAPEAPKPMEATTLMPISAEDPSAYLTRQGQSPWPASTESSGHSPVSTQLMSESILSKAMEATILNEDSALAPVPPEVTAMEDDSPLAKAADIPPPPKLRPSGPGPDRTTDTSIGMAVTPATLLMPIQAPLDPTVPIKRLTPAPMPHPEGPGQLPKAAEPPPRASQPVPARPGPEPLKAKVPETKPVVAPPSVPGYPDRQVPAPPAEHKFQTKPIASPVKPLGPAPVPVAEQAIPTGDASKIWIPVAIGILLLVIGGIYFAFFRTSLKGTLPLVTLPTQTAEPSLPVPAGMQGTLAQAKTGDSKAMHMLGVSFYYGLNVPQNKAEGLRWMRKAAEAGNEKAKSDLRQMEAGGR